MKYNLLGVVIVLLLVMSCTDDEKLYQVGEDFIETETRLFVTDTSTLKTATIIADSLITSDSGRILLGGLRDDTFGNLTAQSYLKYMTSTFDLDDDAVYDSIALVLHYDRYYHGDTTRMQTYNIYEITEDFEPNDEEDIEYFYNTSSLSFSNESLGEISFTPYPNKKDSIIIPLNDTFGQRLFDLINDDDINSINDLERNFKGITITANPNNNTVLGFSYSNTVGYSDSSIRLYYTIKDEDEIDNDYMVEFSLMGTNSMFNNIVSDKSSTLINSLIESEDILSSSFTNNKLYLQSGTGISMRVEMPNLKTFNSLENDGTSLNAELKIFPDNSSYTNIDLIDSLAVYIIDKKNRQISSLQSYTEDQVYAKLNTVDDEFDNEIYYSVDVGYFVEEMMNSAYTLDYALRIEFPDNTNSINQLLIHDENSPEDNDKRMKLEITYLTY